MKKILYNLLMLSLLCIASEAESSVRVDLDDRSPEEVVAKSLLLAEQNPLSQVTGCVWMDNGGCASGIALDPHTVLTAAHIKEFQGAKSIWFVSSSNIQSEYEDCLYKEQASSEVVFYEDFFHNPMSGAHQLPIYKDKATGQYTLCDLPLEGLTNLRFTGFQESKQLCAFSPFFGTDLAIVKLKTPLPDVLLYPEILDKDIEIKDKYCISLGFGPMKFNTQEHGAVSVTEEYSEKSKRHLISVKTTAYSGTDIFTERPVHLIHGNYQGILCNGSESFIPNETMMKTEGLPVSGDSGGPLLFKFGDSFKLVGLMSSTHAPVATEIEDPALRDTFGKFIQPVFPVWTDIRFYQDWIKSHMGPIKK
jgi:hypothetical protein